MLPSGDSHANLRAVPDRQIRAATRVNQGNVFEETHVGAATDRPIGMTVQRQAGTGMLIVARPGIGRITVQQIFQPRQRKAIDGVAAVEAQGRWVERGQRIELDAPTNHGCASLKLLQSGCEPCRINHRVTVGADHETAAAAGLKSLACSVHQQASHMTDVGLRCGQLDLFDVIGEGRIGLRKRLHDGAVSSAQLFASNRISTSAGSNGSSCSFRWAAMDARDDDRATALSRTGSTRQSNNDSCGAGAASHSEFPVIRQVPLFDAPQPFVHGAETRPRCQSPNTSLTDSDCKLQQP